MKDVLGRMYRVNNGTLEVQSFDGTWFKSMFAKTLSEMWSGQLVSDFCFDQVKVDALHEAFPSGE